MINLQDYNNKVTIVTLEMACRTLNIKFTGRRMRASITMKKNSYYYWQASKASVTLLGVYKFEPLQYMDVCVPK